MIYGVQMEVPAYGGNYSIFEAAFPVSCRDIYVNTQPGKIRKRFLKTGVERKEIDGHD